MRNSQRWRASVMFAVGRNSPARGDRDVSWLADVVVNDVVDLFVGEQPGKGEGRTAEGKAGVDVDFLLRRAKSGAAKNVVDLLLPSAGHVAAPEGLSPMTAWIARGRRIPYSARSASA